MKNAIKILIFGLFFAVIIVPTINSVAIYQKAKTYSITHGIVTAVSGFTSKDVNLPPGKRVCGLWYKYSVGGFQYEGDAISPERGGGPDAAKCRLFLNGYTPSVGESIAIYYNPISPEDSLYNRDFPIHSVRAAIIYILFLIILLLLFRKAEIYIKNHTIKVYD